jgi:cation diffusion facilitator family transporter
MVGNIVLSVGKLVVGLLAHSGALVSDAIHSASDVVSTVIVMIGLKISNRASDNDHPYGHERLECVCSIILAILLMFTGLTIGYKAIVKIGSSAQIAIPGIAALVAAVVSIVVKELMYHYTMWAAKKVNSTALKADAWHHRSDAFSSVGSFVGILGARLGFPKLDAIASLVICLFILKVSYDIFKESFNKVVDKACDSQTQDKMSSIILGEDGVLGIDLLNTRMFGSKIYVDVEISADASLPLEQAHSIAENVHHAIEANFDNVKHCMVHVNPAHRGS